MFKKPLDVKNNTQLKKSSQKQFRLKILNTFPGLTEDKLLELVPRKENVFCIKISTHSNNVIDVYCVQKVPLLFEYENAMYPTVYMLWKVPDLIPSFITHHVVFSFISNGADLMLPGVITPEPITKDSYGSLHKGSLVCVTLENNNAAMAVGVTAMSSLDMYMSNKRGKCVSILHFYGDHLSSLDKLLPVPNIVQLSLPEPSTGILNTAESDKFTKSDLDSGVNDLQTETCDQDGSEHLNTDSFMNEEDTCETQLESKPINRSEHSNANSILLEENKTPGSLSESQNTGKEMEKLLMYCFLKCLKTSARKVPLPLLVSNFFKMHILSACPEENKLDLKKTKYKKLSAFLEEMEGQQLIKCETISKGVSVISFINYDHESLKTFEDIYSDIEIKVKDPAESDLKSALIGADMYCINDSTLPLFSLYLYKRKDTISREAVKNCIRDYVEKHNLVDSEDRNIVILDELLETVTGKTMNLTWTQLIEAVINKLGNVVHANIGNRKAFMKGKVSPIDIQVGIRSCNKKVTLVNNLELHGINVKDFCQECEHGVAAGTNINQPQQLKSSAQVQVQGNQVAFVSKLLMNKYKIPVSMIRGLENIQKKKKY